MFDSFRQSAVPAAVSPRRPWVSRVLGLGLLALSLGACSQQGEGERCDPLSYSEDCESGLVCTPLEQLHQGAEGAVCCPANPTQNICRANVFDFKDDAGAGESSELRDGGSNATSPTNSADAAMSLPGSESSSSAPNQSTVGETGADAASPNPTSNSGNGSTDGEPTDGATASTGSGPTGTSSEPASATADGGADAGG